MKKFVKKPVVIEAVQITAEMFDFVPHPDHLVGVIYNPVDRVVRIPTPEGEMIGRIGDWIIRGIKGELYPCQPDIFELTYEADSLISERTELQDRIDKLNAFIHRDNPVYQRLVPVDQELLRDQLCYMEMYAEQLRIRIRRAALVT